MNNQLKWAVQDYIKKHFLEMIKKGKKREELIIIECFDSVMEIPEIEGAINFLVNDDYIEALNETEYIITKGYYDWLLAKVVEEVKYKPVNFNISTKLKQRFCKDMGIPINIFHEPYFESRIKLYNYHYDSIAKYKSFIELLNNFKSEQDYFEYYNKLKDDIISYLGSREGIKKFKEEDMNKFKIENQGFPRKDIYKETFDNGLFLGIDMKKANFNALKHYDKNIVGCFEKYEDFIGMFTEHDYFKESKYLRQVVFGNHNPRRQTTYEKHLMDKVLTDILKIVPRENIVFFANDEVVIHFSKEEFKDYRYIREIRHIVWDFQNREGVPLSQDLFKLRKIPGAKGYVKKIIGDGSDKKDEFKCLDALTMPFVLRAYLNEEIQEEDKIFFYEGKLAKLIEIPKIEVV